MTGHQEGSWRLGTAIALLLDRQRIWHTTKKHVAGKMQSNTNAISFSRALCLAARFPPRYCRQVCAKAAGSRLFEVLVGRSHLCAARTRKAGVGCLSCDGKEVFVAMPARALFPTLDEAPRLPEWMLRRGVVAEVSRAVALLSRAPAHACELLTKPACRVLSCCLLQRIAWLATGAALGCVPREC